MKDPFWIATVVSLAVCLGCGDIDSGGNQSAEAAAPGSASPGLAGSGAMAPVTPAPPVAASDASADGSVTPGLPAPDAGTDTAPASAEPASADAGMNADAGRSTDGGEGAGASTASGCDARAYLICEDFEDTDPGAVPEGWYVRGDATVVAVSDEQAHGGARSLWLGPIEFWERRIARDADVLGASHWGRIHYRVQVPVPDAFVHSTLVAFQGTGPLSGPSEFRVVDTVKAAADAQGIEGHHQFLYNVQPQGGAEFGTGTSYDWEFDGQWHCAEWFVDATTQTYLFYLDGAELIRIENGAGNYPETDLPDSFDELRIGWNNYQSSPPGFTAWLDDLAIDHERVGCD